MKQLIIEWVPFSTVGRNWWVYAYPSGTDGLETKGGNAPTADIQGQFESVEAAQTAFPEALLSESAKAVLAKNKN